MLIVEKQTNKINCISSELYYLIQKWFFRVAAGLQFSKQKIMFHIYAYKIVIWDMCVLAALAWSQYKKGNSSRWGSNDVVQIDSWCWVLLPIGVNLTQLFPRLRNLNSIPNVMNICINRCNINNDWTESF